VTPRRGRPPKQRDPAAVWEYATDAETEGKCVSRRLRAAGIWEQRERTWNALHRDARRQAILAQLREAFAEGERGLAGWPEICAWLNAHHFRNREGRAVTPRVAAGWRARLGMPVLRGRPGRNGLYRGSLPWERGAIAATSPAASGDCEVPKPAAEATATAKAAERVCTWCGWKWLSPTPFRPTRCPRCTIVADPEVPL
jgi:hypothetical protein